MLRGWGVVSRIHFPWIFRWIAYLTRPHLSFDSHIKEHLKEEIGDVKEEISDEDMQFHYFRLHDYDGNKKLDGLEIFKALSHYHNETGINDTASTAEENMAETVDQILSYDDTNNDGYIDYPEYIKSQEEIRNGSFIHSEATREIASRAR